MVRQSEKELPMRKVLDRLQRLEQQVQNLEKLLKAPRPKAHLLSTKEAASYIGVSRSTLYRYMDDGLIGFVRIGSQRKVNLSELDLFLEKERVDPLPSIL